MTMIGVLVAVDERYLNQLTEISRQLQTHGMEVRQLLNQVGVITGFIDSTQLDSLRAIEGVRQVEPEQEFGAI
jgi:hypothetical protein